MLPLSLPVLLLVLTAMPMARARPPWWRVLAGCAAAALLTAAVLWPTGDERAAWQGAVAIGVTNAVVPMLLAAADPVRGWRTAFGRPRLDGAVARILLFPLVAGVLSALALTWLYLGGAVRAGATSDVAWVLVQTAALVVGVLVALPLLTDDLLPAWVTPALKAGLAMLDGVVDALPGIVVMTTYDWVAGQSLLAVAELVAVPVMLWVAVGWARHDSAAARRIDAELDAAADDGTPWWEREG